MKFSRTFDRWKGPGQPTSVPVLLGADTVPAAGGGNRPNATTQKNLVTSRFVSINGWPCYRIAVLYLPPAGAIALNGDMHMYEDTLDAWFRVNGTPGVANILANAVSFFDCVALLDLPHTGSDLGENLLGTLAQLLVVADPGAAPNGLHRFAMAADLTTFG